MDTNRSDEQEEASYSDDFEHDLESQDSPFSEDKVEIKVFKSSIGSLTVKPKKINKIPASAGHLSSIVKSNVSNTRIANRKNSSMRANQGSTTSIHTVSLGKQALAQEKVDPHDIPASLAASLSSVSISRLSVRNRSASGYSRGTANNIRRVQAHTAIKEKSYASAKFKTYHNPPLLRGVNQPPLKAGLAKPNTNVAQRVASAKRMTIMDLKSRIKLLQDEIETLKKENRFLNHLHHRQDNALRKWEGKDAELPKLLNQHKDEIRSLQAQLRRAQQNARDHNEKLSVRDKKILRLETEMDKLKELVHEEHLQDRHTLQQDLESKTTNLIGAEKRLKEYMRHIEILEKNHRHQLVAQERKLIKVNTHTYELQQTVANLKLALRNKDRMLNYIQMRSSGRTLIRAFHAERVDRGDDALYGTSLQTDQPYQPPSLPAAIKSHSFDLGNSRGTSPSYEDMRDYEFFSTARRLSNDLQKDKKAISYHHSNRQDKEENENGKMSRPHSRLSQSLESVLGTHPRSPKKEGKSLQKSRSVVPRLLKPKGSKTETKSKMDVYASNNGKVNESIQKGKNGNTNKKEMQMKLDAQYDKTHRDRIRNEAKDGSRKSQAVSNSKLSEKSNNRLAQTKESVELIYQGASKGFKYEGPFVNYKKPDCKTSNKKESTEILYSPKSGKQSEHSISSTCTSRTMSSSRSDELISNIDVLSARIRESCVLVPPPEEALKSPQVRADASARAKEKVQISVGNKPCVGPAGDNINSATSPHENQFQIQNGIFQPVQYAAQGQELNSPRSHQSFLDSPRVHQLQSISLPSVTTTGQTVQQSSQFQLAQPSVTSQTNFLPQLSEPFSTVSQGQLSFSPVANTNQYASPRMSQSYLPVQTINVVSDPQTIALHQDPQQSQPGSSRLSYFSYANNADVSPNSNITLFQTNPSYGQQTFTSPSSTNFMHAPIQSPQTLFVTASARGGHPSVDIYNSNQVNNNTNEQSLPSINSNSKKNQPSYNPKYYVNLGAWK